MKESKIRGVVTALRAVHTWNTHQLRWFTVTLQVDVEDIADNSKVTQTNMEMVIDDPAKMPGLGDLVILTVQVAPLDDEAPEPPPLYGDEVALADPEEEGPVDLEMVELVADANADYPDDGDK